MNVTCNTLLIHNKNKLLVLVEVMQRIMTASVNILTCILSVNLTIPPKFHVHAMQNVHVLCISWDVSCGIRDHCIAFEDVQYRKRSYELAQILSELCW